LVINIQLHIVSCIGPKRLSWKYLTADS